MNTAFNISKPKRHVISARKKPRNHNLEEQLQEQFDSMLLNDQRLGYCHVSDIIEVNPLRKLSKSSMARCIEMSSLSTSGPFPSNWEYREYNGGMKFINGDTIMARITPCLENGKVSFVNYLNENEVGFGSTEYIVMHSKKDVPVELTYFLARNKDFVDYAVKNMNGSSGRQRVSGDTIAQYELPIISKESIDCFANNARSAMNCICKNCFENRTLAQTRDLLLPKLMKNGINALI